MVWLQKGNYTMSQMLKFGIVLSLICLAATLVLATTYEITKPKIKAQFNLEEQDALKEIIPKADSFQADSKYGIDYFNALKDKKIIGYCIKAVGTGYSGYIRMIVGMDLDGTIRGVRILEHYETPGLGARINEVKPDEKDAWFLRQFIGKDAKNIAVKQNIDAITGATISSKAVTDAIKETVNKFLSKDETKIAK